MGLNSMAVIDVESRQMTFEELQDIEEAKPKRTIFQTKVSLLAI